MPHIIVEYSEGVERDIDIGQFMGALRIAAVDTKIMAHDDIKVRATSYSD